MAVVGRFVVVLQKICSPHFSSIIYDSGVPLVWSVIAVGVAPGSDVISARPTPTKELHSLLLAASPRANHFYRRRSMEYEVMVVVSVECHNVLMEVTTLQ